MASSWHDVVGQFHAYLITEKRVAQNTFLAYKRDIAQFEVFLEGGKIELSSINKKHLSSYIKFLRDNALGSKSIARKVSSIKLFFRYLNEMHHIPNIAQQLAFPKIDKTLPCYLTQQEIEKLLLAANGDTSDKGVRNKVMLYVLYASGMRVSELVNLTVDNIHFDTGFIKIIGKGSKERMVPLPKNILELLRYYLEHTYPKLLSNHYHLVNKKKQFLFAAIYSDHIKPISRQSFWLSLKKILQQADILKNVSPHSMRHSLATHLLQQGADLRSLQMLLGHQNLSTVQIYTHLGNTELRKIYDKKHPRAT